MVNWQKEGEASIIYRYMYIWYQGSLRKGGCHGRCEK